MLKRMFAQCQKWLEFAELPKRDSISTMTLDSVMNSNTVDVEATLTTLCENLQHIISVGIFSDLLKDIGGNGEFCHTKIKIYLYSQWLHRFTLMSCESKVYKRLWIKSHSEFWLEIVMETLLLLLLCLPFFWIDKPNYFFVCMSELHLRSYFTLTYVITTLPNNHMKQWPAKKWILLYYFSHNTQRELW